MPDTTADWALRTMQAGLNRLSQGCADDYDAEFEVVQSALDELVQLRARVAELEAGGVSYGVRYPDDGDVVPHEREATARRDARTYADEGAYVVQRRVGSWTPVDREARDA